MSTWVPAYGRLFDPDHDLAAGESCCRRWAWLDLCYLTQRKDTTRMIDCKPVRVERGQLLVSERFLSERWVWSRGKVQRFIAYLEHPDVKRIEVVRRTRAGTIYALPSFDEYALGDPPTDPLNGAAKDMGGNGIPHRDSAERSTGNTIDRTSDGPLTGPNKRRIQGSVSKETSPTVASVGFFFEKLSMKWTLSETITEWSERIEREPKYAGADIPYEIRKAADWWDGSVRAGRKKKPKRPTTAILNWLEKAARDARSEKTKQRTGPPDLGILEPIYD